MIFLKNYLKKKRFYTGKQTNDAQTHGYHAIAARIAIQQTPNTKHPQPCHHYYSLLFL